MLPPGCVLEIYLALNMRGPANGGKVEVVDLPSLASSTPADNSAPFDLRSARCASDEDYDLLMAIVRSHPGGSAQFERDVRAMVDSEIGPAHAVPAPSAPGRPRPRRGGGYEHRFGGGPHPDPQVVFGLQSVQVVAQG